MFINLGNVTVNTDHIVKMTEVCSGYLYHLTDGSTVCCNVSDCDFMEKVGTAYLPALPGFERLECSFDDSIVFASPVVGWRVDGFGTAMPVCVDMTVGGVWLSGIPMAASIVGMTTWCSILRMSGLRIAERRRSRSASWPHDLHRNLAPTPEGDIASLPPWGRSTDWGGERAFFRFKI
jgi:hypothetical protein